MTAEPPTTAGAFHDSVTELDVWETLARLAGAAGAVDLVSIDVTKPAPAALTAPTANLYVLPPIKPDTTAVAEVTEKLCRSSSVPSPSLR